MKCTGPGIAAILCLLLFPSVLRPPSLRKNDLERKKQILVALENEWLVANDTPTLNRILAEDFVHPVASGNFLSKAEHIDWFTKHPPPSDIKWHFERMQVRIYGDVGIVTGMVAGIAKDGRDVDKGVFTDVFVYRNGRWQAVSAQETSLVAKPVIAR